MLLEHQSERYGRSIFSFSPWIFLVGKRKKKVSVFFLEKSVDFFVRVLRDPKSAGDPKERKEKKPEKRTQFPQEGEKVWPIFHVYLYELTEFFFLAFLLFFVFVPLSPSPAAPGIPNTWPPPPNGTRKTF